MKRENRIYETNERPKSEDKVSLKIQRKVTDMLEKEDITYLQTLEVLLSSFLTCFLHTIKDEATDEEATKIFNDIIDDFKVNGTQLFLESRKRMRGKKE